MAWPLSRLLDFIDHSTPWVSADFLNQVQDAIVALFGGGKTVKSLKADGTGGAASDAAAGSIVATGNISSTSGKVHVAATAVGLGAFPTPAIAVGDVYADLEPIAWARVDLSAGATFVAGVNIANITAGTPGALTLTLGAVPTNALYAVANVSHPVPGQKGFVTVISSNAGAKTVDLQAYDETGAAADRNIFVVVYGC